MTELDEEQRLATGAARDVDCTAGGQPLDERAHDLGVELGRRVRASVVERRPLVVALDHLVLDDGDAEVLRELVEVLDHAASVLEPRQHLGGSEQDLAHRGHPGDGKEVLRSDELIASDDHAQTVATAGMMRRWHCLVTWWSSCSTA